MYSKTNSIEYIMYRQELMLCNLFIAFLGIKLILLIYHVRLIIKINNNTKKNKTNKTLGKH